MIILIAERNNFSENSKRKRNNIRSSPHLNYTVETNAPWNQTCQTPGFVPVAVTAKDIQKDINEIPEMNTSIPHWVAGTNMRWVWIIGLFVLVAVYQLQSTHLRLRVFPSFRLSVCVHDNSKNNGSIHLKLEHVVVFENSSEEVDIGHCLIKVKVTA